MPRIRSIKPEFATSASVGRLSRDARLCFILLWTQADDDGRLRGDPRMLAGVLFPYDDDARERMAGWLDELVGQQHIVRYSVGGDPYIAIPKWLEHQRINRPTDSHIPAPDESSVSPHGSISEPSVSGHETVTVGRDRKGMEGKGMEGMGNARAREGSSGVTLIVSPLEYEKSLGPNAFTGSRLEVPRKQHQDFMRNLGGEDANGVLMAQYLVWNAEAELSGEATPRFKWVQAKFNAWVPKHASKSVLDNWVKKRQQRQQAH